MKTGLSEVIIGFYMSVEEYCAVIRRDTTTENTKDKLPSRILSVGGVTNVRYEAVFGQGVYVMMDAYKRTQRIADIKRVIEEYIK
jgi:hypothetical protein